MHDVELPRAPARGARRGRRASPRERSKTMISSTDRWPRTSVAGPGCSTQVMRVVGCARLSALITGSTCTASPTALIITMQMWSGTRLRDPHRSLDAPQPQVLFVFGGVRQLVVVAPLSERANQVGRDLLWRRAGSRRAEAHAIDVEHVGVEPRTLTRGEQDVLEIEIRVDTRRRASASAAASRSHRGPSRDARGP